MCPLYIIHKMLTSSALCLLLLFSCVWWDFGFITSATIPEKTIYGTSHYSVNGAGVPCSCQFLLFISCGMDGKVFFNHC